MKFDIYCDESHPEVFRGIKTRMPLVCQAGPAAEAFVGSLPSVKNNSNVKDLPAHSQ
ncbi:MAG: hypothetical protein WCA89_04490 [Terracidiphilus sp.]|jgi:hypothetical protein